MLYTVRLHTYILKNCNRNNNKDSRTNFSLYCQFLQFIAIFLRLNHPTGEFLLFFKIKRKEFSKQKTIRARNIVNVGPGLFPACGPKHALLVADMVS